MPEQSRQIPIITEPDSEEDESSHAGYLHRPTSVTLFPSVPFVCCKCNKLQYTGEQQGQGQEKQATVLALSRDGDDDDSHHYDGDDDASLATSNGNASNGGVHSESENCVLTTDEEIPITPDTKGLKRKRAFIDIPDATDCRDSDSVKSDLVSPLAPVKKTKADHQHGPDSASTISMPNADFIAEQCLSLAKSPPPLTTPPRLQANWSCMSSSPHPPPPTTPPRRAALAPAPPHMTPPRLQANWSCMSWS